MAITYIEFGVSPVATSTTCVVVKPANLAIGNLMIAHIGFAGGGAISAPDATWTLLQTGTTTGTVGTVTVFYKIATSTDVATTDFTFTGCERESPRSLAVG